MQQLKNYPALITIEERGPYSGHIVHFNGQQAYYRPYDGSAAEAPAED